jgi:hypothetical protein
MGRSCRIFSLRNDVYNAAQGAVAKQYPTSRLANLNLFNCIERKLTPPHGGIINVVHSDSVDQYQGSLRTGSTQVTKVEGGIHTKPAVLPGKNPTRDLVE